ncbi:protein of unknown function [Evansella caseinilytica]|uniref:DUF4825 domain-containing protein n=1 Tax=Evansella caseinilytica TaxID=1503961 RepID=A0A1H3RC85_9BACI|nr:DUF4825 domain-containing protein [Evansella caseinilytica]SDZ22569.1 protein of unknown function [Evansella caseinilytica]
MKVSLRNVLITALLLFSAGCSQYQEKLLQEYGGTYVGDNGNVSQILSRLPGADSSLSLELTDQIITVNYHHNQIDGEPSEWLETGESMGKMFMFNAIYLSILVPNANGFVFHVEEYSFSITKSEIENVLTEQLGPLLNEEEKWDPVKVEQFISEKKEAIIDMIDSNEFRESFFAEFPITIED